MSSKRFIIIGLAALVALAASVAILVGKGECKDRVAGKYGCHPDARLVVEDEVALCRCSSAPSEEAP